MVVWPVIGGRCHLGTSIPAFFKAKWNTNETLSTLMMNYIATQLVAFYTIVWEMPKGSGKIGIINQKSKYQDGCRRSADRSICLSIVVAVACDRAHVHLSDITASTAMRSEVVGESERTAQLRRH